MAGKLTKRNLGGYRTSRNRFLRISENLISEPKNSVYSEMLNKFPEFAIFRNFDIRGTENYIGTSGAQPLLKIPKNNLVKSS